MAKLLTLLVLTKNEEQHLPRLFKSTSELDIDICILDSFSKDSTTRIAQKSGARVLQHEFVNYAAQFQWGLDNFEITTPWIMRMDADEYLTPELSREIQAKLPTLATDVGGVIIKRRVYFMDKWIRFGGYYPIKLLRIWRNGMGTIEQRWMDEHIVLSTGSTQEFSYDLIDQNLNNLTWWTDKHNFYATREAVDLLNRKYHFFTSAEIGASATGLAQNERKRWYKNNIYAKSPLFLRAFLYFIYRYVFLLGFLDGRRGLVWHILQGLWYRFLVDAKIFQIKRWSRISQLSVREVIEQKFNFKIDF